ncbi:MAG: AEC family transporter [Pseudohongiellaceae bacterium]
MLQAAESLAPIILLIFLGSALSGIGFMDIAMRGAMDRFTYWIALPSLFLQSLANTNIDELQAGNLVLVMALATFAMSVFASAFASFMKLPKESFGVFVQATFRGNLAFVGLPLIIFALNGSETAPQLVSESLLVMAALIPLYNLISIFSLLSAGEKIGFAMLPPMLLQIVKNPLIISALAGSMLGWLNWGLPVIADRPLELLGQTALALALVSLGGALVQLQIRGNIKLSLVASLLKVAVIPLLTYGLTWAVGLGAEQTFIAMILAACPTAAASYVLTTQLGGDHSLAATSIVGSTVLSMITLTMVLLWF